jgi:hypothetical protein
MSSGTRLPDEMLDPSTHVHLSFEVSHGWTSAFETGVFVETSPSSEDRHPALTGFHFRPKYRLAEWPPFPFHVSVSLEYAFIKNPGDVAFRQAIAFTPIFERHVGRLKSRSEDRTRARRPCSSRRPRPRRESDVRSGSAWSTTPKQAQSDGSSRLPNSTT